MIAHVIVVVYTDLCLADGNKQIRIVEEALVDTIAVVLFDDSFQPHDRKTSKRVYSIACYYMGWNY